MSHDSAWVKKSLVIIVAQLLNQLANHCQSDFFTYYIYIYRFHGSNYLRSAGPAMSCPQSLSDVLRDALNDVWISESILHWPNLQMLRVHWRFPLASWQAWFHWKAGLRCVQLAGCYHHWKMICGSFECWNEAEAGERLPIEFRIPRLRDHSLSGCQQTATKSLYCIHAD